MSSFKITVTRIDAHPDGVTQPAPVEVFSQTLPEADFGLPEFVLALNKKKRARKSKSTKP